MTTVFHALGSEAPVSEVELPNSFVTWLVHQRVFMGAGVMCLDREANRLWVPDGWTGSPHDGWTVESGALDSVYRAARVLHEALTFGVQNNRPWVRSEDRTHLPSLGRILEFFGTCGGFRTS